jgi:hypothetical protein
MRVKLTDRFVKSVTTEGRKSPIFMDDEVIGFGIQICEGSDIEFSLSLRTGTRLRSFWHPR